MNKKIFRILLTAAFAVFFIDRFLKSPFAHIEYFRNTGIAFSLPLPMGAAIFVSGFIILGFAVWLYIALKKKQWNVGGFLLSTLLGAASNFIDRLIFGATLDYIYIGTGVFNLADVLIFIGVAGLIFFPAKSYKLKATS